MITVALIFMERINGIESHSSGEGKRLTDNDEVHLGWMQEAMCMVGYTSRTSRSTLIVA